MAGSPVVPFLSPELGLRVAGRDCYIPDLLSDLIPALYTGGLIARSDVGMPAAGGVPDAGNGSGDFQVSGGVLYDLW